MNKIVIQGRVCKDIELKSSGNGTECANISVAVDRKYNKDKENKETDFFDVAVFGKQAAFAEKYFHKGDGILISGRMESRKFQDKETGKNRVAWSLIAEEIEFPIGRKSLDSRQTNTYTAPIISEIPDGDDLPF